MISRKWSHTVAEQVLFITETSVRHLIPGRFLRCDRQALFLILLDSWLIPSKSKAIHFGRFLRVHQCLVRF